MLPNRLCLAAVGLMLTITARADPLITERQLPLSLALAGAEAAIESCASQGYKIAVSVVDRAGNARATLRGDGANRHLLEGALRKAYTSAMLRIPTVRMGEIIAHSPGAAGLMDFEHMTALGGGLPIIVGEDVVGRIGVAGVPVGGAGGAGDEGCARVGLARIMQGIAP